MPWLLAATTDWSWVSYVGPFAPVLVICVGAIAYLRHELTEAQARVERIADQRLELAKQAIPVVQAATEAIRASAEMVDRHAAKLGEANVALSESRAALERIRSWLEYGRRPS